MAATLRDGGVGWVGWVGFVASRAHSRWVEGMGMPSARSPTRKSSAGARPLARASAMTASNASALTPMLKLWNFLVMAATVQDAAGTVVRVRTRAGDETGGAAGGR